VAYLGFHKGGSNPPLFPPPSLPLRPTSSPSPPSPPTNLPSQARSHDCQNEAADRSSAPSLPFPPSPPLHLEVGPLNPVQLRSLGSTVSSQQGLGQQDWCATAEITIHITPLLGDQHWLRIPERIAFRLAVLVFRCRNSTAPEYLARNLQWAVDEDSC